MRKIDTSKYVFFDFEKFVNVVFDYYKQHADLIGLNENQIVGHINEKALGGLSIDIFLVDVVDNNQEFLSTKSIADIGINIDIVLTGFPKSTAEKTYSELAERTMKLALITDGLSDYLSDNGFQMFCTNVNTFQAVRGALNPSNTMGNGCLLTFTTQAYRRRSV